MKFILTLFSILTFASVSIGQEEEMYAEKYYVVLGEYRSYSKALRKAQKNANQIPSPLNLRNLIPDTEIGLTSNEVCGCGEKHGYIPRGRYDDGKYISIEFSNGLYDQETDGYYVVVLYSGSSEEAKQIFDQSREKIKNIKVINGKVYMGCMH
ncbi:MAG: hypothetical protein EP333_02670 [Bacteroidetes bacterium]|nr:MAG: hypothetical protein EP333_02670 [Bacteroidota bacterium]